MSDRTRIQGCGGGLRALLNPCCVILLAALPLAIAPTAQAQVTEEAQASAHPAMMMEQAAALFQQGQRDEAVFWFYLGQLRYRTYLTAHPELDPSGEPAVFSSLMATLGPPINEWAFGDIDALASTLDRVLAYDQAHPDPSLPEAVRQEIRSGLVGMRDTVVRDAASIRAQREANGLGNR